MVVEQVQADDAAERVWWAGDRPQEERMMSTEEEEEEDDASWDSPSQEGTEAIR